MWTYYLQYGSMGQWALFRKQKMEHPQMLDQKTGKWRAHEPLLLEVRQGNIGQGDVISEDEARARVSSVGGTLD